MGKEIYVVTSVDLRDNTREKIDGLIYTERCIHLSSSLEKAENWLFHSWVNTSLDPNDYKELICVIHDTIGTYRDYYVGDLNDRSFFYRIGKMYLDDELE